jgi:hypothetical protein
MIRIFRLAPKRPTKKFEKYLSNNDWTVIKVSESILYGSMIKGKFRGEKLLRAVPTSWFNSLSKEQQDKIREVPHVKLESIGTTAEHAVR